jgi:hypothetical protein
MTLTVLNVSRSGSRPKQTSVISVMTSALSVMELNHPTVNLVQVAATLSQTPLYVQVTAHPVLRR